LKTFTFLIDALYRIIDANADWFAFAAENDAPELFEENVFGKSLMDFIGDEETRHLYHLLFDRVRRQNRAIELPFRCDSPAIRRFMTMRLVPVADKAIRIETEILREEVRIPIRMPNAGQVRSKDFIRMCSWCKRIEAQTGWSTVEEAVRQLKMFHRIPLPGISHGICPDCEIIVRQEIESLDVEKFLGNEG